MKLLYVVPRATWETKMSRVRFQQVEAIGRDDAVHGIVHITGPGWPDWDGGLTNAENVARVRICGESPTVALAYGVGGLAGAPVPVALSYNEANEYEKVNAEVMDCGADLVVFHHANDLPRYRHLEAAGVRLAHVHHCADTSVYRDYGLEKDVDVLCCGNMNSYYYPFRYRLMRFATRVLAKRGYRVRVLPHPGYALPPREGTLVGEDFARAINRAKLTFTCSMRYNYELAKYSEIALCRSLPVGDVPAGTPEREAFWRRNLLVVEPWMSDDQIQRIVEDVLDDPEELARRTNQVYDAAQATSTMAVYARRFVEVVEDMCASGTPRRRRVVGDDIPVGARVVCSYLDAPEARPGDFEALTDDAAYTVEEVWPTPAPTYLRLAELDGWFPATVFRREEEGAP